MDDPVETVYLLALAIALWGTAFALGLSHTAAQLIAPARRAGLVARLAVVDVLLVPVLVWALVQAFAIPDGYAVGLLLVGIASAGPLAIKAAQVARADVTVAVSLVVLLELVNLAAIPVWAALLLPAGTDIQALEVLRTLVVAIVLPLAAGLLARRLWPGLTGGLASAATRASSAGLALVVAIVLARDADTVAGAVGDRVPAVAFLAVVAALALGWLAAGSASPEVRASTALVTGVRASALALAIAAASFPDRLDVRTGIVVFALVSVVVPLALAVALGRKAGRRPLTTA